MKSLVKKFMTSALLGFSAFLSSGNALADNKPPKLHASKDALRAIDKEFKDELLQWAGRDVLLITDKDFQAIQEKAEKKDPEINFFDIDFSTSLERQFRRFPVDEIDPIIVTNMAYKSKEPSPFSFGFKARQGAHNNTHCVIVIKSEPIDARSVSAQIASQSEYTVENISITPEEASLFILAHEARHCDDDRISLLPASPADIELIKIRDEAESDQFAILSLSQLDKKGKPLVRESSIEEWISLRSIGSFTGANVEYSIAGSLENSAHGHNHFNTQRSQEMIEAHSFIWTTILARVSDVGRNAIPQLQFIRDSLRSANMQDAENPPSPFKEANELIALWVTSPSKRRDIDVIVGVNDALRETMAALSQSENPYERQVALLAPTEASSYFSLHETYGIVQTLNNEGAFRSNPLAQKEVDLFIRATEKHFPSQAVKLKPTLGMNQGS